jgi:hypothetical protein
MTLDNPSAAVHAERAEADLTVRTQGVRPPVDWEAVAVTPVTAFGRYQRMLARVILSVGIPVPGCGPVGIRSGAVTADDLDAGVGGQPVGQGLGVAAFEQVERCAGLNVDQQRAVVLPAADREDKNTPACDNDTTGSWKSSRLRQPLDYQEPLLLRIVMRQLRIQAARQGAHPARCQPLRLACRRRTSAATAATSTGMVVSTVISEPTPTGRSYLSIVASVAVVSQWTSCLCRAL